MNGQTEFSFINDAKRREQLLLDVQFKSQSTRTLLAAILREIAKHRECWISQETFGKMFKTSRRTIVRAFRVLSELNLVATVKAKHQFADGTAAVLNHYSIVWPELERLVQSEKSVETLASTVETSEASVETSESTVETKLCLTIEKKLTKKTTTEDSLVVVVSECGVARAAEAVAAARERGLSDDEIRERYQRWRELPTNERLPGVLYNWLALDRSYEAGAAKRVPGRGDAMTREQRERESLRGEVFRDLRNSLGCLPTDAEIEAGIDRVLNGLGFNK